MKEKVQGLTIKVDHDEETVSCSVLDENEHYRNQDHQMPVNTILHGHYLIGRFFGGRRLRHFAGRPDIKEPFEKGKLRFQEETKAMALFDQEPNIMRVTDFSL